MSGTAFPPPGPTTLQGLVGPLRSYLYKQYEDDDALQTFVAAQNYLAQQWLDDFNSLNLPVWSALSGQLLDWVGWGLYGIRRPILSYQKPAPTGAGSGPYATMPYDTLAYGGGRLHPANTNPVAYLPVSDDVYQRILTWHLYRGDGYQFSTRWLKRRVHRFLNGVNGYLAPEDNTYDVSITANGTAVTITVTSSEIGTVLQYACIDGILALPFQFQFTVSPTLVAAPNAAVARIAASAGMRGALTVPGHTGATLGGTAGISASIGGQAGRSLLTGESDAQASISGNPLVLHQGNVQWPITGVSGGAGSISGRLTVVARISGLLPGTAG